MRTKEKSPVRSARSSVILLFAAAMISASCSTVPGTGGAPAEIARENPRARAKEVPPAGAKSGVPGSELADPVFASLDPAAKAALIRLSRAFAERDAAFLLSQGEANYASRVRPSVSDDAYLALLYRIGPYASESEGSETGRDAPLRLRVASVSSLRFTGMETRGPVAQLDGRIGLADGTELPCHITLLWRLSPPRIIGREP